MQKNEEEVKSPPPGPEKKKRFRRRGPRYNDPIPYTSCVTVNNAVLHSALSLAETTMTRAAIVCASSDRIHGIIVHRLFGNLANFEMVMWMWLTNIIVFMQAYNPAVVMDRIVRKLMISEWFLTIETGTSDADYCHPFGKCAENDMFSLPLFGFDAIISQCLSTLLSRLTDTNTTRNISNNQVTIMPSFPPLETAVEWREIRESVLISFIKFVIDRSPIQTRERMREQLCDCLAGHGFLELAGVIDVCREQPWSVIHRAMFMKWK